jgi:hypothetical protein
MVLPYDNQTGDPALEPIGRMAAEWITEGLAQTGGVQVAPNLMVVEALATWRGAGAPTVEQVARNLASGIAVTGSYYRQGDSLEFHSEVVDVPSGRPLGMVEAVRGPVRDPSPAIEALRQRVTAVLAFRLNVGLTWELPPSARPPSYESYQAYAAAMEAWVAGDYRSAAAGLERAYALDSLYLRALVLASAAYNNAGDRARADSVLAVLAPRGQRLSPYDRHRLEWGLAQRRGDFDGQLRALHAAVALVPLGTARWNLIVTTLRAGQPRTAVVRILGPSGRAAACPR